MVFQEAVRGFKLRVYTLKIFRTFFQMSGFRLQFLRRLCVDIGSHTPSIFYTGCKLPQKVVVIDLKCEKNSDVQTGLWTHDLLVSEVICKTTEPQSTDRKHNLVAAPEHTNLTLRVAKPGTNTVPYKKTVIVDSGAALDAKHNLVRMNTQT